jgi:hypothetical protein
LGSHEPQDVTEPHIFGMYCPFCRDCLAQGVFISVRLLHPGRSMFL